MPELSFRFVCAPAALSGAPAGWAREMLREGEVALLAGDEPAAISRVAHDLDQPAVRVIRTEASPELQDQTVIAHAGSLPLIWVADNFSDHVSSWARDRGPMTLLVQSSGPLDDEERRRIDRFVAILGRQSE